MPTTVAQYPITIFTTPVNGTSPIDADEVRDNDNLVRTQYNQHDADTGIHVQSSVFGSRPAAGTSGRKYLTVDNLSAPTEVFVWYDDGTNWYEIDYLRNSGGTLSGGLTISTGGIAVTGNSTITGTLGGVTTLTATTVAGTLSTAAQPNVTSVGTLTALTVSGDVTVDTDTLKVDSANNRVGIGTASPSTPLHVVGASTLAGAVTVSSGSVTVNATARSSFNGTLTDYAGVWINQSVTTSGAGFGSALGFGGTVTAGADGAKVIGVDLDNMVWATGGFSSTEFYGIRIPSVSGGGTNYAIYTNAGAVRFGDTLTVAAGSTTNALTVTTTGAIKGSFRHDGSNRLDISVSSAGAVTFDAVGASAGVTFSDGVTVSGALTASSSLQVSGTFSALGNITLGNANTDTIEVQGVFINNLVPFVSSGYSLGTSGNTWSAAYADRVFTAASATGGAGLRLPHGAAPTSPVDGDMWTTSSGLFVRINGVTKTVTLT